MTESVETNGAAKPRRASANGAHDLEAARERRHAETLELLRAILVRVEKLGTSLDALEKHALHTAQMTTTTARSTTTLVEIEGLKLKANDDA